MKTFKAWAWYCIQLIWWIGWITACIFGFVLLMSDKTHDKEQMQGNVGGAIMALILGLLSIVALFETIFKYPKKHSSRY